MASIDTSEVNALSVDISGAGERAIPKVRVAVVKTAVDLTADAKIFVAVDTGNLRGSIGFDIDPDGLGLIAGPTADYGKFVEDGTSRMAAQPFMGPAFDRRAPLFADAVAQAAAESI